MSVIVTRTLIALSKDIAPFTNSLSSDCLTKALSERQRCARKPRAFWRRKWRWGEQITQNLIAAPPSRVLPRLPMTVPLDWFGLIPNLFVHQRTLRTLHT